MRRIGLSLAASLLASTALAAQPGTFYGPLGAGVAAAGLGYVDVTAAPYNADKTGVADSTAAFTNASASGAAVVWVPPGSYKVCGATMSSTFNQVLLGAFSLSKIVQGNCGSPAIGWNQTSNVYSEQTIADLGFDSTAGTNHTINTTGAAGLTLRNLYFTNTPAGYDNIYVNGAASTAAHDMKVDGIQAYASAGGPHGNAVIEFGPYSADSDIINSVSNGDFLTAHGLQIDSGAVTLRVAGSHLYNVSNGALYVTGCSNCQFSGNTWDNSSAGDVAQLSNVQNSTFTGEQFEATNPNYNAITLANSSSNTFTNTIWGTTGTGGGVVAKYAVNETGTSDYNKFIGGTVDGVANWTAPIFNYVGAHSQDAYIGGHSSFGVYTNLQATTSATVPVGSTVYFGAPGAVTTLAAAVAWRMPQAGFVRGGFVDFNAASGAAATFYLYDGATQVTSCTAALGSYGCAFPAVNYAAGSGDNLWIQSATPAGLGSVYASYAIAIAY